VFAQARRPWATRPQNLPKGIVASAPGVGPVKSLFCQARYTPASSYGTLGLSYVIAHCRGDRRVDYGVLGQVIGSAEPPKLLSDRQLLQLGKAYGIVNPFDSRKKLQYGAISPCGEVTAGDYPAIHILKADSAQWRMSFSAIRAVGYISTAVVRDRYQRRLFGQPVQYGTKRDGSEDINYIDSLHFCTLWQEVGNGEGAGLRIGGKTFLADAVASARANGRSWGQVAMVLGVSKQAAAERFGSLGTGPKKSAVRSSEARIPKTKSRPAAPRGESPAELREWARKQGYSVGERGRVPTEVNMAYDAAHQGA